MIRSATSVAVLALVLLVLVPGHPQAGDLGSDDRNQTAAADNGGTRVVLLGTGTPNAEPDRWGPATAIIANGTPYLVDFGPGIVRRASAAAAAGIEALDIVNLKRAFVTHLHSDHTTGYADLILAPWVQGREEPLVVYGPEGIEAMTQHILEAYRQDVYMRLYGSQPISASGYKVEAHEIKPGVVYEDPNVVVEAFAVDHGSWPQAFGYKFVAPDRTVVVSGDAIPSDSIVDACNGCDVLVHEVYSQTAFEGREPKWQRYHSSSHTSAIDLGQLAERARPGLLVLTHQLYWGASDEELMAELRAHYDGEVVSGRDLGVY